MSTNLKFITGFSGEAHISPSMDAQWHSALSGKETFVYDYGEKFDLTVNQAMSTISIKDGVGQIQGRLFIIEESLIETISYPNVPPEVGLTRIDTILLHWGTDTTIVNGESITVNTCEFEYHKNPLANGQAESFEDTDLNLGDTDAYFPMWHVTWTENGIQEVEAIFTVKQTAKDVWFTGYQTATGFSFTANQSRSDLQRTFAKKEGYTALIRHAYSYSHSAIDLINATADNSTGTITFWAVNRTSSSISNVNFAFYLIYIRNDIYGGSVTQP